MERRGEAQQHKTSYGGLQMKRERSGLERSLSFSHRLESGKAGAYRSSLSYFLAAVLLPCAAVDSVCAAVEWPCAAVECSWAAE